MTMEFRVGRRGRGKNITHINDTNFPLAPSEMGLKRCGVEITRGYSHTKILNRPVQAENASNSDLYFSIFPNKYGLLIDLIL